MIGLCADKKAIFYTDSWGLGGIVSVLMELFESDSFQSEVDSFTLVSAVETSDYYDSEIARLGGRRYCACRKDDPGLAEKLSSSMRLMRELMNRDRYDLAHINVTNGLGNLFAYAACRENVPVRIVHAHNSGFATGSSKVAIKRLGHVVGQKLFGRYATCNIACSDKAGKFVFGDANYVTMLNGVDVDRFRYKRSSREKIRESLGVNNDTVLIGSVSILEEAKNPLFQIELFDSVQKLIGNCEFVMAGEGSMRSEIEDKISALSLNDSVKMVGRVGNPEDYYCAMDLLLLPSFVEGFPMTCIESQCAGTPVLTSTAVTEEVELTKAVSRVELGSPMERWTSEALRLIHGATEEARKACGDEICNAGLSAESMCAKIVSLYR